jgi:hypothetical protein
MTKSAYLSIALLLIAFLCAGDAFARGFRGGGGRGGGAAYRGGAAHRSPSMGHRSYQTRSAPTLSQRSVQQRPPQRAAAKRPAATKPGPAVRPSQPSRDGAASQRARRPSRSELQGFLDMPKGRPGAGTGDLAKIGAGAAMGALGVEGARKLLESRPQGPGERPGRPEKPIARPPDRPGTPDRPGRPEQPIARPPDRPGKPERPTRPERPSFKPPGKPGTPPRPDHPIARPPYRPGGPPRPVHPIYGRPGYPIRPHWWRHATWAAATGWIIGASFGAPRYYDYDSGIYYEDEAVYVDGTRVASAEEYYDQAIRLAQSAPKVEDTAAEDWLPLGVFALSREGNDSSNMVLQLAVNKEGVIQGTYYNTSTDTERPIKGMVDKKTQRAAWTFADGKNTDVIMETGLYNLTKDDTEALVHFGENTTQKWRLVRLQEPESRT